jgi:type IV secretion system protein VirB3
MRVAMTHAHTGRTADALFVGATRPPMRWGVTYAALIFNLVFSLELFLASRNLLALLLALPIHGICALLCVHDARFFDLLLLWMRTRLPTLLGNGIYWKASSYCPLNVSVGRRHRHEPTPYTAVACPGNRPQ